MNARVVKPNGAQLLLCEYHRVQQNRTKKRSDMKYRQDRAKKRLVLRQERKRTPGSGNLRPKKVSKTSAASHKNSKQVVKKSSTALHETNTLEIEEGTTHMLTIGFDRFPELRVGMSPPVKAKESSSFGTSTISQFSHSVSPLCTPRRHFVHVHWLPEEVKLLEYFIM
jgi:hypothetical protein